MKVANYYEDISTPHVNTLPDRAYYIPFESEEKARKSLRESGCGRQAKKRLKRRVMTRAIYENPQKSSFHFPEFPV